MLKVAKGCRGSWRDEEGHKELLGCQEDYRGIQSQERELREGRAKELEPEPELEPESKTRAKTRARKLQCFRARDKMVF